MPGKCETCDQFKFILNKCLLCSAKYCNACQYIKYLRFAFDRNCFPAHMQWMHGSYGCPYEKRLAYNLTLCSNCYYNYTSNITENCISDSVLAHIFIQKVIKPYDIIVIYDDPSASNNSAFLFLSDMHKLINQKKITEPYPYELFYYTALPDTPWVNKKELPAYKQSLNRFSPDVADIISVYDSVFLDERKLRELADRFIQSNEPYTKALAGFLTLCAKHEIQLWPCAPYPKKKNRPAPSLHTNNGETHIINEQRAMSNDILKHHIAITPFRNLTKKAIIVVPQNASWENSGSFNAQTRLENQLRYVVDRPPHNRKKCKIATVQKRFMDDGRVRLVKNRDNFLLTY